MPDSPVIGITASSKAQARRYVDGVQRSGGTPWLVLPGHRLSPEDTLRRMGGLLVTGGPDIDPSWYGQEPAGDEDETEPARDAVEIPLLKAALDEDMPVLGICRGMQALNVALGGRLIADISGHDVTEQDGEEVSSYHRIYIAPGSKLAAIVGSGGFVRVNSLHHQGLKDAQRSPHLMTSAYSLEDGIIEALESPGHSWAIGVQFHPERRMEVPPHFDRLFQSLVERAQANCVGPLL